MDLTQTKELLDHSISLWESSYYTWYSIFIILSILSIVLPLIIASGIVGDLWKRILGLATAVCVGILSWGNIGIAAGNFDEAATKLKIALVSYPNDQAKLADAYKAATDRLHNNGPTAIPQTSTTKTAQNP